MAQRYCEHAWKVMEYFKNFCSLSDDELKNKRDALISQTVQQVIFNCANTNEFFAFITLTINGEEKSTITFGSFDKCTLQKIIPEILFSLVFEMENSPKQNLINVFQDITCKLYLLSEPSKISNIDEYDNTNCALHLSIVDDDDNLYTTSSMPNKLWSNLGKSGKHKFIKKLLLSVGYEFELDDEQIENRVSYCQYSCKINHTMNYQDYASSKYLRLEKHCANKQIVQ